eukprot:gnl/Hemi2/16919_TR5621_c0_g1_i1.p1 gnl/Hemi2/16919_TR5621_c0_g1~~gnl/Hemi2/16919_TR5621_c0_g1_i1.p1  ORF type:complete len:205 (-),score=46.55 gnl/Hemi2/16919_TR5621_c0_g1_i1:67-681(-)
MQKQRKVVILGGRAVGKSAMTVQFVDNHFVESYYPTIENTFHKVIRCGKDEFVTEIVDTAGQDEYSIFHDTYSVGVDGYVLVYSVASKPSFEMIKIVNNKLLNVCGTECVPRVLVGNKIDLEHDRQVPTVSGQALAAEWGCAFVECTAKFNQNIAEIFVALMVEVEKTVAEVPKEEESCCSFCIPPCLQCCFRSSDEDSYQSLR